MNWNEPNCYEPYTQYQKSGDREQVRFLAQTLEAAGYDLNNQHAKMLPYRLYHYLKYWTREEPETHLTVFDNVSDIDQLVTVDPVSFWSCCNHHLLPFTGTAYFGYLPDDKVIGLSKVPIIIKKECARPWIQEEMTKHLADMFYDALQPKALGLITVATHTCQMLDLEGSDVPQLKCSVMYGRFRESDRARAEFLRMVGIG